MRLKLRASPLLTTVTASAHCAAAVALWQYLPQPGGAGAAALVLILAMVVIKDRTLLRGATAAAFLEPVPGGRLRVGLRDGSEFGSQVSARRYVSRWLVVLRLDQAPFGRRTMLVAGDMLPAADFRRLRLWALWDALPGAVRGHGDR